MRYVLLPPDGPTLATEADATQVIGDLYGSDAEIVAIPLARLAPDFWDLKNRKAGLFIQKLMNYRLRAAFVGDLSAEIAASDALRDYVRECRRGRDVLFVARAEDLEALP